MVAVWIMLALGHICALPEGAHLDLAGAAATQYSATHQGDEPEGEGVHLASCDTTLVKFVQPVPALSLLSLGASAVRRELGPNTHIWTANRVLAVVRHPPLFLLHASFLI